MQPRRFWSIVTLVLFVGALITTVDKYLVSTAEDEAANAEVLYLRTYHDWRLTHPETEWVVTVPSLPPCPPVEHYLYL